MLNNRYLRVFKRFEESNGVGFFRTSGSPGCLLFSHGTWDLNEGRDAQLLHCLEMQKLAAR